MGGLLLPVQPGLGEAERSPRCMSDQGLWDLVRTRAATLHSPLDARELNLPEPLAARKRVAGPEAGQGSDVDDYMEWARYEVTVARWSRGDSMLRVRGPGFKS